MLRKSCSARVRVPVSIRWTALIALAILPGCGPANTAVDREPLEWTGPLADEVDYLAGDPNRSALVRYEFRNVSPDVVQFVEGRADCRCTSVKLPDGEFGPGARGEIQFTLDISDAPGRLVASKAFIGYQHGTSRRARILDLAVNKRRPLEIEPEIVELKPAAGDMREGQVVLTRFTKPGQPFNDYRMTSADLVGDVRMLKDSGWGPETKDGGFLKSSRTIALGTSNIARSGNARLNIFLGEPPVGIASVPIRWSREETASMVPETVLISPDRPSPRVTVESPLGRPIKLTWDLPQGIRVEGSESANSGARIVATLGVAKDRSRAVETWTGPFGVLVECGDKKVRLEGTIIILAKP